MAVTCGLKSCIVSSWKLETSANMTVDSVTVNIQLAVWFPSSVVTVIVAWPEDIAVTSPVLDTVAIFVEFEYNSQIIDILKNIKDTVSLIHENYGTDILFDADKCDDEKTFNLINSLDTENIFELFGSEGANELIKKYPVKNLNDLSV